MTSLRRALRFVSTALVVTGIISCAAIWGFDDLKPGMIGPDGGGDGDMDGIAPACPLAKPAIAPGGADVSGIDFLSAARSVDIGVHRADAGSFPFDGFYDLDDTCTYCRSNVDSCRRSKSALAAGATDPTCDSDGGVDNVGTDLLRRLNLYVMNDRLTSENADNWLAAGRFTMLVAVRGYNGQANDPTVIVDLIPSFGMGTTTNGGPITSYSKPTFTKADQWTYWPQLAKNLNGLPIAIAPNVGDSQAYVRDNILVAHFPNAYFVIQFQILTDNPLILHVTDAVVTARIVLPDGGTDGYLDNGRFAGKWPTGDALRVIGTWSKDDGLVDLCPGDGFYATIKDKLCARRDVYIGTQSSAIPCDGISIGFGLRTAPATLGAPSTFGFTTSKCFNGTYDPLPKSYTDDCNFNN